MDERPVDRRKHTVDEYYQPRRAMQFTSWLETEGECEEWFQWFKSRGIPTAIIQMENSGYPTFAVFRNWLGNPFPDFSKRPHLKVVKEANGF